MCGNFQRNNHPFDKPLHQSHLSNEAVWLEALGACIPHPTHAHRQVCTATSSRTSQQAHALEARGGYCTEMGGDDGSESLQKICGIRECLCVSSDRSVTTTSTYPATPK